MSQNKYQIGQANADLFKSLSDSFKEKYFPGYNIKQPTYFHDFYAVLVKPLQEQDCPTLPMRNVAHLKTDELLKFVDHSQRLAAMLQTISSQPESFNTLHNRMGSSFKHSNEILAKVKQRTQRKHSLITKVRLEPQRTTLLQPQPQEESARGYFAYLATRSHQKLLESYESIREQIPSSNTKTNFEKLVEAYDRILFPRKRERPEWMEKSRTSEERALGQIREALSLPESQRRGIENIMQEPPDERGRD